MVVENTDTTLVKYTHDGADLLFEHDNTDEVQIRYLYGPGIDHILESEAGGEVYQHFADGLGSVTLITDSAGDTVKTITYDSFGNIVAESGSADAEEISYTGRERESEFGLYYYRARYYDPLTGRFISRDPLGFGAGDVNLYRYVGNNPLNFIDPRGLKEYIFVSTSLGFGLGYGAIEGGEYYLIDPSTGEYHVWWYLSGGVGFGFGGAAQVEVGSFTGQDYPTAIHPISLTLSGFTAAGYGVSGQITGTSFWGGGDLGATAGLAGGAGASIAGMGTYSWYMGHGNILPERIRRLIEEHDERHLEINQSDNCR